MFIGGDNPTTQTTNFSTMKTIIVTPENINEAVKPGNIYDFRNYPEVIVGQAEDSGNSIVYDMFTGTLHGVFGGGIAEFSLGKLAPGKLKAAAEFGVSVAAGFLEGEGFQQFVEGDNEEFVEDLKITVATSALAEVVVAAGMGIVSAATAPAWITVGASALIATGLGMAWNAWNDDGGDVNLDGDNNQLVNQSQGSGGQNSASTRDQDTSILHQNMDDNEGAIVNNNEVNDIESGVGEEWIRPHTTETLYDPHGRAETLERFDDGSIQAHWFDADGKYIKSLYVSPDGEEKIDYQDPRFESGSEDVNANSNTSDQQDNEEDNNSYQSRSNEDDEIDQDQDQDQEQDQDPNENENGGSDNNDDDEADDDGTAGDEGRPNPEDRPNPFENNSSGGNNRPNPFDERTNPWDDDYRPNPEDDWGVNGPNAKSLKGMKKWQIHDAIMDFQADSILGQLQEMGHDDVIISGARQNKRGDFQLIFNLDGKSSISSAKKNEVEIVQVVTGFMDTKKNDVSDFLIETIAADSLVI